MLTGFRIGNVSNESTGVTTIIAPKGAVAGVDVRGGAPGTRETALLDPLKSNNAVHAVVLSGGSAYGLEASCGVMQYLSEQNIGFPIAGVVVPIVSSAVIFDLVGKVIFPDKNMGYESAKIAKEGGFLSGNFGAGKGATIGKFAGAERAVKGGVGYSTISVCGAELAVVVVVNAFGSVFDMKRNKIVAGARGNDGNFIDIVGCVLTNNFVPLMGGNTTIGAVLTNAKITKIEANKLARISHNGLAQSISPVHTDFDGDTMFALSSCEVDCDYNMLSIAVPELVRRAVLNAVGA